MQQNQQPTDKQGWMIPTQRVVSLHGHFGIITEVVMYSGTEYVDWLEVRFDHLDHCLPIRPDSVEPVTKETCEN